jgi:hypothetical protein
MKWAGHVAHIREMRNSYAVLVEEPEWRRPLERTRCRWEDSIKIE